MAGSSFLLAIRSLNTCSLYLVIMSSNADWCSSNDVRSSVIKKIKSDKGPPPINGNFSNNRKQMPTFVFKLKLSDLTVFLLDPQNQTRTWTMSGNLVQCVNFFLVLTGDNQITSFFFSTVFQSNFFIIMHLHILKTTYTRQALLPKIILPVSWLLLAC